MYAKQNSHIDFFFFNFLPGLPLNACFNTMKTSRTTFIIHVQIKTEEEFLHNDCFALIEIDVPCNVYECGILI